MTWSLELSRPSMVQRLHPPTFALFLAPMVTAHTFPVYHVNPLHEGVMPFDSKSAFFFSALLSRCFPQALSSSPPF